MTLTALGRSAVCEFSLQPASSSNTGQRSTKTIRAIGSVQHVAVSANAKMAPCKRGNP
eukprot:CAMPEP_0170202972 /NCGR_PEP_ID=MMETSP0116_2-20130129/978_1 /TAXON_ID=400756 /ORGANISM="Durinskia baltica, Strain CSIRO CS-38" /LENGTH=57 /DNA_ID=CAMNT_0010453259 /DNA_START=111 /DNA_END=280 /DNA_ORIENTATION=-